MTRAMLNPLLRPLRPLRRMPPANRWIIALLIVLAAVHLWRRVRDPDVVLLICDGPAQWIRFDAPGGLQSYPPGEETITFRTTLNSAQPRTATLHVRALRRVQVRLDSQAVFDSGPDLSRWKRTHKVSLDLPAGERELSLVVSNRDGPALTRAHAPALGLSSGGGDWQASRDGQRWSPAATADTPIRYDTPSAPHPRDALARMLPWLIPVALIGALCGWRQPRWLRPQTVCLALLAAWVVLAGNNLPRLPLAMGYDYSEHLRYIEYIAHHRRLPLADEGWQMFQSPLYYLLSAPLFLAVSAEASDELLVAVLRIIPMLCGAAQVVLCFYAARYALPGRRRAQALAVLVGGLLPMNLYISHSVGNEPLAGCLAALAIVLSLRYLRQPRWRTESAAGGIGAALSLALLAKVSAVLLAPIIVFIIAIRRAGVRRVAILLIVCGMICGWYYARNVMHFGRPFVAGWDRDRIVWWQDPGYRTPASFTGFGRSLVDPIYAGAAGFWDGLYSTLWADGFASGMTTDEARPPWNYTPMSALMILSLVPSAGILLGMLLGLRNRCLRFAAACVVLYLAALANLLLVVPTYSTVKATYLLGLTPLLGVLFATGVRPMLKRRSLRSVLCGILLIWATTSYAAFFVI